MDPVRIETDAPGPTGAGVRRPDGYGHPGGEFPTGHDGAGTTTEMTGRIRRV